MISELSLALIGNASGRLLLPTRSVLPEAFPIKASDHPGVIAPCLGEMLRAHDEVRSEAVRHLRGDPEQICAAKG
ncbi:MAG: hypothetical protein DMG98_22535 [Acidobacteria bacterium]|nr:MAG: hypothetical protein DMG98_22535 [Acidobacteriota bacterium]